MAVTMKKYTFVGSAAEYWLPDDILVEIDIVPTSRTNVRSRQANLDDVIKATWHDTGNDGATADHERNWLHKHMPTSQSAGYNFAADGVRRVVGAKTYRGKVIQLTPLNEVTWAAGTAIGNRTSWHVEQCFGGANDWDASLYANASLHGALLAAQDWDITTALVQHNVWYGKNCPGQIRRRGIWPQVVNMVQSAKVRALAATGVGVIEPVPPIDGWPYPDPVKPAFWDQLQAGLPFVWDGNTLWYPDSLLYRVITSTKRQQFAVSDNRVVGPDLVVGKTFRGEAKGQSQSDMKPWLLTPELTRVDMSALEIVPEDDLDVAA